MGAKLYTLAEANALLPHLAPALVELREKFEEASKIRAAVAEVAAGNGASPLSDEWAQTLERVGELMGRLEEWSVQLRDIATGLVDFPANVNGEEVFLCWRLGEPEVAFWHYPDDGFAGRRPL